MNPRLNAPSFSFSRGRDPMTGPEIVAPYIDSVGFCGGKMSPEGNAMLTTAHEIELLKLRGELTVGRKMAVAAAFRKTYVYSPESVGFPIYFLPHPLAFQNDQQSVDNFVGMAVCSDLIDPTLAGEWLIACQHSWTVPLFGIPITLKNYLPNEEQYRTKFGWRAWFGKFLALRCAMGWAAEHPELRPSVLARLGWIVTVATAGMFAENQDPFILTWHLINQARRRKMGGLYELACQIHERRRAKKYPTHDMQEVFAYYFRPTDDSPPQYEHWTCKLLEGI